MPTIFQAFNKPQKLNQNEGRFQTLAKTVRVGTSFSSPWVHYNRRQGQIHEQLVSIKSASSLQSNYALRRGSFHKDKSQKWDSMFPGDARDSMSFKASILAEVASLEVVQEDEEETQDEYWEKRRKLSFEPSTLSRRNTLLSSPRASLGHTTKPLSALSLLHREQSKTLTNSRRFGRVANRDRRRNGFCMCSGWQRKPDNSVSSRDTRLMYLKPPSFDLHRQRGATNRVNSTTSFSSSCSDLNSHALRD